MKTEQVPISKLRSNRGQIEGLPKNPRLIKDHKYYMLVESIAEDPEMLDLREIIAYDTGEGLVVIAGNQRLKAAKEVGLFDIPTKVLPKETPVDKLKRYAAKDNAHFGEWDFAELRNNWDLVELKKWAIEVPVAHEIEDRPEQKDDHLADSGEGGDEFTFESATEVDEDYEKLAKMVDKLPDGEVKRLAQRRLGDFISYRFDVITDYYNESATQEEKHVLRSLGLVSVSPEAK